MMYTHIVAKGGHCESVNISCHDEMVGIYLLHIDEP
jgi:hypothetical protein